MRSPANRALERTFRRYGARWNGRTIATMVSILLLIVSCVAVGWGWGYNTRVAQECAVAGGSWHPGAQICESPKHTVIDLGQPGVRY